MITGKEEVATEKMMQRTLYTVKMLAGKVGRGGQGWAGVHRCAMCGLELL